MRTPSIASAFYAPGTPPTDPAKLPGFLLGELNLIRNAIDALVAGHFDKTYVAPAKPRDGDLRYADGTSFKPNGTGGVGIWYYNGSAWVLLG